MTYAILYYMAFSQKFCLLLEGNTMGNKTSMFPDLFIFIWILSYNLAFSRTNWCFFGLFHQSAYFQAVECCSARLKATEKPALVVSTKSCLAKGTPRSSLVTFQASILMTFFQSVFGRWKEFVSWKRCHRSEITFFHESGVEVQCSRVGFHFVTRPLLCFSWKRQQLQWTRRTRWQTFQLSFMGKGLVTPWPFWILVTRPLLIKLEISSIYSEE